MIRRAFLKESISKMGVYQILAFAVSLRSIKVPCIEILTLENKMKSAIN